MGLVRLFVSFRRCTMTADTPAHTPTAAFREAYEQAMALWPVPVERLDLPSEFGSTRVNVCGPADGPPLVLLHGGGTTSAVWYALAATLARTHRVHAVDQMGGPGLSAHTGRALRRPEDLLDWLDGVFSGLGLASAALLGHSYGGWLALSYAAHTAGGGSAPGARGRVNRLVLLDPTQCFAGFRPSVSAAGAAAVRTARGAEHPAVPGVGDPGCAAGARAGAADGPGRRRVPGREGGHGAAAGRRAGRSGRADPAAPGRGQPDARSAPGRCAGRTDPGGRTDRDPRGGPRTTPCRTPTPTNSAARCSAFCPPGFPAGRPDGRARGRPPRRSALGPSAMAAATSAVRASSSAAKRSASSCSASSSSWLISRSRLESPISKHAHVHVGPLQPLAPQPDVLDARHDPAEQQPAGTGAGTRSARRTRSASCLRDAEVLQHLHPAQPVAHQVAALDDELLALAQLGVASAACSSRAAPSGRRRRAGPRPASRRRGSAWAAAWWWCRGSCRRRPAPGPR